MKHLKKYKVFENFSDIESILIEYNIRNWTINEDGTVDVEGDVDKVEHFLFQSYLCI